MEYILLRNSRISAKRCGVKLSAEVYVDGALHPHVDGECLKVCKAEQGNTGRHLVTDTLNRFKAFKRVGLASCRRNHVKIYPAACDRIRRINDVFIPESGL